LVGWYHSHPGHGVFLSAYDQFIQNQFFPSEGQVAMVIDPQTGEEGLFVSRNGKIQDVMKRGGKKAGGETKVEKAGRKARRSFLLRAGAVALILLGFAGTGVFRSGYGDGYKAGDTAGFDRGYAEGDTSGYQRGLTDGDAAGYERGYPIGKDDGYKSGLARGTKLGSSRTRAQLSGLIPGDYEGMAARLSLEVASSVDADALIAQFAATFNAKVAKTSVDGRWFVTIETTGTTMRSQSILSAAACLGATSQTATSCLP
jgi:hypothetical protein